jgi:hypothetical protein
MRTRPGPQALKRWRLMLKALPPECRDSLPAAAQEAARRIWGAKLQAAAAAEGDGAEAAAGAKPEPKRLSSR